MKQIFTTLSLSLMILFGSTATKAQDFCDLYGSLAGISDCFYDGNTFGFTIDACQRIRFEITGNSVKVNDREFELSSYDGIINYGEYVNQLCGYGSLAGVQGGSPSDPRVQQVLNNLQSRLVDQRLIPTEVKDEQTASAIAMRILSGNLGTGNFEANGVEGKSSAASFGYALEWETGYSLGTNVSYNKLSFDNVFEDLSNYSVNLYGEKATQFLGFDGAYGVGYNHIFVDDALGEDSKGVNLYFSGLRAFGKQQLTTDFQLQYSKAGELEQQTATLSAAYGIPLGNRGAINADATLVKVDRSFGGNSLPGDDFFAVTGLVYDYYLGDFVIKLGARKVLMLDGYSNIDYVFGGGLRY